MRIYSNCKHLMSEIRRDVMEMGVLTHSNSMQNKDVSNNPEFDTKEIINYQYCLTSIYDEDILFPDAKVKKWAEAELQERLHTDCNPGEAYKLRPEVWDQFLVDGKFDYAYPKRMNNHFYQGSYSITPLAKIISEIRSNPDSRQLILSIWDRSDIQYIGGQRRVPCSIYYQFILRDYRLHIIYNQRSADIVTHLGNDIWLAFKLMEYIAKVTGHMSGYLYHNIGSLHSYRKDWSTLQAYIDGSK